MLGSKLRLLILQVLFPQYRKVLYNNLPSCFLSRYLYLCATENVNNMELRRAKLKLHAAVLIEKYLSISRIFLSALRLNLSKKQKQNESVHERIASLYARYRYEIYFGSFIECAKIRKSIVSICASWLRKTPDAAGVSLFVVRAAMEAICFKEVLHILDKFEKQIYKKNEIIEIKKFMQLVCELSSKESNWANIIGPNYNWDKDSPLIKGCEINICLNKTADFLLGYGDENIPCSVVYINRQFLLNKKFLPKNDTNLLAKVKCRKEDYEVTITMGLENSKILFDSYTRPNKFLMNGNSNMAQAAVYDLITQNTKARLVGLDLFTYKKLYQNDHHTREKSKMQMNSIIRTHDPLSNFAFLKILYRERVVVAQGSITVLNDLSIEDYAKKIQDNFGNIDIDMINKKFKTELEKN